MKKTNILIVDDEKNTRDGLQRALKNKYTIHLAEHGQAALDLLNNQHIDLVLSDIRMPKMDGLTLTKRILARDPQPICILLTAYGSVDMAVQAMKLGAYDFLTKPLNLDRLELIIQRALRERTIVTENRVLHEQLEQKFGLENIIGNAPAMQDMYQIIRQVAPTKATVLIQGESGTGKEMVAQAVHRLSPRAKNPLIPVHCAALSETLLESELFGHEKGAFTGATQTRKGRFERADSSSLFLDEIGEINPSTQVKILRVLEERTFERVGAEQPIEVDVRLIAATNKNLKDMIQKGTFREDLYFRLNVVVINLPPLRQRTQDIPLLINHFTTLLSKENNLPHKNITPDALESLTHYPWPGNIRELRNTIERMLILSQNDQLTLRDIPQELRNDTQHAATSLTTGAISLDDAERQLIIQALQKHNGNRTQAAQQLGISRRTLHRKLNQYDLRDHT